MSTTLKSIIEEFSEEDQQFVQRKATLLAEEMMTHADSLAEVRAALIKTQDEVARVLKVNQNAVAQLEKRSDLLISTLRKYVEAMGGELAVAVRTGAGTVIMLDSLSSLAKAPPSRRTRASSGLKKPALSTARKATTKPKTSRAAAA